MSSLDPLSTTTISGAMPFGARSRVSRPRQASSAGGWSRTQTMTLTERTGAAPWGKPAEQTPAAPRRPALASARPTSLAGPGAGGV